MLKVILLIVIFLAVMYVFLFMSQKKRKRATTELNAVARYHNDYILRREEMQKRRDLNNRTQNYVTKYNQTLDYREKTDLSKTKEKDIKSHN